MMKYVLQIKINICQIHGTLAAGDRLFEKFFCEAYVYKSVKEYSIFQLAELKSEE